MMYEMSCFAIYLTYVVLIEIAEPADSDSKIAALEKAVKDLEKEVKQKDNIISDLRKRLEKTEVCQTGILRQMAFLSAALSDLEQSGSTRQEKKAEAPPPISSPRRKPKSKLAPSPRSSAKSPKSISSSSRSKRAAVRSKSVSSLPSLGDPPKPQSKRKESIPKKAKTPRASSAPKPKLNRRPRAKSMEIRRAKNVETRKIKARKKESSGPKKSNLRSSRSTRMSSSPNRSISRHRKSPSPTPRGRLLRSRSNSKEPARSSIPRPQLTTKRPTIVPRPQLARSLDTSEITKDEKARHQLRKQQQSNRRKLSEGSGLEPMFDPGEAARQRGLSSSRKRKEAPPSSEKKEPRKRRAAKARMHFVGDRLVEIESGRHVYTCMVPKDVTKIEDEGLPVQGLELKQVHGYNGRDTKLRDNLIKLDDHLYYSVANIVVDYNLLTGTQSYFKGHTATVTSVASQENGPLMASGQFECGSAKTAKICIWNRHSMSIVAEIEGYHEGAVYHLSFSTCSKFLYSLSGDENHTLIVFDVGNGTQVKEVIKYSPVSKKDIFGLVLGTKHSDANGLVDELLVYGKKLVKSVDIFDKGKDQVGRRQFQVKASFVTVSSKSKEMELAYHSAVCFPFATRMFAVGGHSGTVYIISRKAVVQRLPAHKAAAVALTLCDKGFISASKQGMWKIWKYSRNKFKNTHSGNFNRIPHILGMGVPRTMQYDPNTAQLYVGSRKNQIFTMDLLAGKGEILMWGHSGPVCALVKHPKEPVFITGSHDGHISCWNSETWLPIMDKHIAFNSGEKVNCAVFTSDGCILVCGTLNSKVLLIDFSTFEVLQEVCIPPKDYVGDDSPSEMTHVTDLCFNSDGTILAVGHGDCSVYLFSLNREREFSQWDIVCNLNAPCQQIQFSNDSQYLKTLDAEKELTRWKLNLDAETVDASNDPLDPEQVKFFGDPLTIGWDVVGLAQPNTEVIQCSKTALGNEKLIASGSTDGNVRLHKYPAMTSDSFEAYSGHGGEICRVSWILDDTHLVTVGRHDSSIFIWKLQDRETSI